MDWLREKIGKIEGKGLFRSLRRIGSPHGVEIEIDGHCLINFCSNNYLGLAADSRLKEAAREAVERFGAGSGAARLVSGNSPLHEELESGLARFKGAEAALLFNSGYHANIGVIPVLAEEGDVIFSDEFNHASLIDGCRLSRAKKIIYRHNDLNQLEGLLQKPPLPFGERVGVRGRRLIVTEAVFSMEGDLCPLKDLLGLAERYGATVYLDEAHAVGVFGEHGEGLAARNPPPRLICMGTLGKAFGSYGAFIAGSKDLRDYLINRARSFIFTTALPPAAVGASLAALKIIQEEPSIRENLWRNVGVVGGMSPIFSIKIGDAQETMEASRKLMEEGIYIQGIRPPSVPEGTSRLRLTVTATHTPEQIERLVTCLKMI